MSDAPTPETTPSQVETMDSTVTTQPQPQADTPTDTFEESSPSNTETAANNTTPENTDTTAAEAAPEDTHEDETNNEDVDQNCEMLGSDGQDEASSQGNDNMDETIESLHQMHLSALDSLKELSGRYSALASKQKEQKKTHNCCATVKRAKTSNQKIQALLEEVLSELKVQFDV